MSSVRFGAQHVFTLQTHPSLGEHRQKRQNLKYELGQLAEQHGLGYNQYEDRTEPDQNGYTFQTQIVLDTGANRCEYKGGQVIAYSNAGDEVVRRYAQTLPDDVQYYDVVPREHQDFSSR